MKSDIKFSLFIVGMIITTFAYSYTGKQEFKVNFDDGYTKFINDGNKVIILEVIKPSSISNSEKVNCVKKLMKDGVAIVGSYNIKFESNFGVVNGKKFPYSEKKTELFTYYDVCN